MCFIVGIGNIRNLENINNAHDHIYITTCFICACGSTIWRKLSVTGCRSCSSGFDEGDNYIDGYGLNICYYDQFWNNYHNILF